MTELADRPICRQGGVLDVTRDKRQPLPAAIACACVRACARVRAIRRRMQLIKAKVASLHLSKLQLLTASLLPALSNVPYSITYAKSVGSHNASLLPAKTVSVVVLLGNCRKS